MSFCSPQHPVGCFKFVVVSEPPAPVAEYVIIDFARRNVFVFLHVCIIAQEMLR